MDDVFWRIINREISAYVVYEDDRFIAFLDINPVTKGHTLLVPKVSVDYIFDLDDALLSDMMVCAKKVSRGIINAISCIKVATAVVGLEVPHAHMHLIPINSMDDFDFARHVGISVVEMQEICDNIRRGIML